MLWWYFEIERGGGGVGFGEHSICAHLRSAAFARRNSIA